MKEGSGKGRQVALITGASRGIGRAVAIRLAQDGCDVVLNYAGHREAAEEVAELCGQAGAQVLLVQGDVSDPEACEEMIRQCLERFGGLDILVNNAGINRDAILMRMSEADFRRVIDVDLMGVFFMMRAAARTMVRNRYGRIINISSVSGLMGNTGQANYSAAKAGVVGLTKAYAREVATRGITVNAVAPGMIRTEMTEEMSSSAVEAVLQGVPAGRMGEPEDIAGAVAFLADRETGFVTGHVLCVDGGMCM
jgi:3-oxoacyl-[acyl-carrier protein] reductase